MAAAGKAARACWHSCSSRFHGEGDTLDWAPCLVLDYRESDGKYLIRWTHDRGSRSEKWVTRLNVQFTDESKARYVARIAAAQALRSRIQNEAVCFYLRIFVGSTKTTQRFEKYINTLQRDGYEQLSTEAMQRVMSLLASPARFRPVQQTADWVHAHLKSVFLGYFFFHLVFSAFLFFFARSPPHACIRQMRVPTSWSVTLMV